MLPKQKNTARHIHSLEQQAKAIELRRSGKGFKEIGAQIGCSKAQAFRYVQAGLTSARDQVLASADELRVEELSRLDALLESIWFKARKGDVAAIDRVLKIIERRAKLLGIEAPIRIEATGKDGAPMEVSSTATIDPSKLSLDTLRQLLDARIGNPAGG